MSVIKATRKDDKRGTDDENKRQLIDNYIIEVDSTSDEPSTIYDSQFSDIPQVGDSHPTDPLVIVKTRTVKATQNRLWYEMEVNYDNSAEGGDQGGGGGGGGPVEVLQVSVTSWYEDFIMETDVNGIPIRNSATDKIKYQSRRPHPLITISAQTKAPRMKDFLQNIGRVNDGFVSWLNNQLQFLTDQLMFDQYNAESIGANNWKESFVFKARLVPSPTNNTAALLNKPAKGKGVPPKPVREAGWQPELLDAGFFETFIEDGVKVKRPIRPVEKEGDKPPSSPTTSEWPLNSGGIALSREQIEAGKVFFRSFQTYEKFNFNLFQFDFTLVLEEKKKK
jgi:hypothetical protein